MTIKIHIIYNHYEDYFDWTMTTFRYTNGEFVESMHSTIRKEEQAHNFRVTRILASDIHQRMSLKSLVWSNSRRSGLTPASKLSIRHHSNQLNVVNSLS